jgi:tripartite-type tricarboxylate transporter receptor subunit TctC
MKRRQFVTASAIVTAVSVLGLATPTFAKAWPERPITLIVPFAPGGATDMVGRIMADQLGKTLGQTVIIENKGGAAGAIGMADLARSKPDGYTFALITDSIPIQPLLNSSLPWDMSKFEAVAKIATSPEVLVVNPGVAASSVKDFVQYAKSKPGELSYAASSTGSVHHLAGEVFKQQTDIDMIHIPYKGGGQSLVDMASGRVDAGFIGLAPVLTHIKSGQLKALALTGKERNLLAPDVPTFREAGYGDFDVELWIGLVGLKETPPEAISAMKSAITQIVSSESVQKSLRDIGFEPVMQDNTDFAAWVSEQQQGWNKVIKQIGMR